MRLSRYLFTMGLFMAAVVAVAAAVAGRLENAFLANPFLNALLVIVFLSGVAYILVQTLRLGPEIQWMQAVRRTPAAASELDTTPLLGGVARLMAARGEPIALTRAALRSVLDGIAVRLDETREVARYLVGLMIFLGLLGTFWGLLKTVGAVGAVVQGLSMSADPTELFRSLKAGLEGPLSGMGTAFSSSLLGLAGSLVLGFLDLQLGQAQNRFFIELEDWLFASATDEAAPAAPAAAQAAPSTYLRALVEQTSENIGEFRRIVIQAEEGRRQTNAAINALALQIGALAEAQGTERRDHARSTEFETNLARLLDRLLQALDTGELGGGQLSGQLRGIEAGIQRLAEEASQGRAQAVDEIRGEIRLLSRVLGAAIDNNSRES